MSWCCTLLYDDNSKTFYYFQVMFFSTKIFNMAGMSNDGAKYATLGMGSLNVLMTLISLFLVELTGRKTLLMIGFSSMFVVTVMLTIALMFVVSPCLWHLDLGHNIKIICLYRYAEVVCYWKRHFFYEWNHVFLFYYDCLHI